MKKNILRIAVAVSAVCFLALPVCAQPGGGFPGGGFPGGGFPGGGFPGGGFPEGFEMPTVLTVEEEAAQIADEMKAELALDEKQYNKVVNLYVTQLGKEREVKSHRSGGMGGFPGGGMPMGGPGMGGGMPMGGPGMGGGMPMGGGFGMYSSDTGGSDHTKLLERIAKQTDRKLKGILNEEQYATWRETHPVFVAPAPAPAPAAEE